MTQFAKVIAGGKVVIPSNIRRELGIEAGDSVVFDRDDAGHMVLKTRTQVVREVQGTFRRLRGPDTGGSVVDELLAERREEACREEAKTQEWLARNP